MSNFLRKPFTFDRVIRIVFTVGVFFGLILLMRYLSAVLIPFAVAWLLAYWLNPLVNWIQRGIRIRILAILCSLMVASTIFVLLGVLLVPLVAKEFIEMGNTLGQMVNNSGLQEDALNYLPEDIWLSIEELTQSDDFQHLLESSKFLSFAEGTAKTVLPRLWEVFAGIIDVVIGILGITVILLYVIFILLDYDVITTGWKNLIPMRYREIVVNVIDDFNNAMGNYFRAQALVAGIVGVLFAIGFGIIGLPMGILLGLFIGLLNMVPYLQILGFVPAFFFAYIHHLETDYDFWSMAGWVMLVFAVVQLIQEAILTPKIMGSVTGLSPAAILLSLSIWGKLLGMLGLLIALPVTFLLLSYYRRYLTISEGEEPIQMEEEEHVQVEKAVSY